MGLLVSLVSFTPATVVAQSATATPGLLEGLRFPSAVAHEHQQPSTAQQPSIYDRIWRFTEWYRNDKARLVQRVQFTGRYQHDFATVRSAQGDHDEWNIRRMRLGGRVTFFRTFILHSEADLNPQERNPTYVRLTSTCTGAATLVS